MHTACIIKEYIPISPFFIKFVLLFFSCFANRESFFTRKYEKYSICKSFVTQFVLKIVIREKESQNFREFFSWETFCSRNFLLLKYYFHKMLQLLFKGFCKQPWFTIHRLKESKTPLLNCFKQNFFYLHPKYLFSDRALFLFM